MAVQLFPQGFTPQQEAGSSEFIRMPKPEVNKGVLRVALLTSVAICYEYWTEDNKPVRSATPFKSTPNMRKAKPGMTERVKEVWNFIGYDFDAKTIGILAVSQKGIKTAIFDAFSEASSEAQDPDEPTQAVLGDNGLLRIKVGKNGQQTTYACTVVPFRKSNMEVGQEAIDQAYADMMKLLFGGEGEAEELPADADDVLDDLM